MHMLAHVGLGGMTFAVILSAQSADEVTCASHSDAAPLLLSFISLEHSFLTVSKTDAWCVRFAYAVSFSFFISRTSEITVSTAMTAEAVP